MALSTIRGLYFEEFVVGDSGKSATRTITETDIVNFCGLSGDFNEIHTSEEYSRTSPAGRRIAHGILGLSIASGLAVQMGFMIGTVEFFRAIDWEFVAPIYIGDTIHVQAEVQETKAFPRLKNGKITFKVSLLKHDGTVTQRGTWTLLVKMKPAS
jgi:3-hydroxybutyryl-CoA dehydratase